MRREPLSHLIVVVALAATTAAGAANLIENPGFDEDLSGWIAGFGSMIEHGTADELGSPASGSVVVTSTVPGQTSVLALQCVPVVAGRTYVFGAGARLSAAQPGNAAFVSVEWFSGPDCAASDIDTTSVLPYFMHLRGVWGTTQKWETAPPGAQSAAMKLRANTFATPEAPFRAEFDNAFFLEDATCAPSPTTLCLNEGRFRVIAEWMTKDGGVGFGRAVPLTEDSGYFWFFNDANVELVTKLLDACPTQFNTFWFFAAGLTNVETVIRVHDTGTDTERVYMNPLDTPFAPIQDTDAFDTCP